MTSALRWEGVSPFLDKKKGKGGCVVLTVQISKFKQTSYVHAPSTDQTALLTRNAQSARHSAFPTALLFQRTLRRGPTLRGAVVCFVAARGRGVDLVDLANVI